MSRPEVAANRRLYCCCCSRSVNQHCQTQATCIPRAFSTTNIDTIYPLAISGTKKKCTYHVESPTTDHLTLRGIDVMCGTLSISLSYGAERRRVAHRTERRRQTQITRTRQYKTRRDKTRQDEAERTKEAKSRRWAMRTARMRQEQCWRAGAVLSCRATCLSCWIPSSPGSALPLGRPRTSE